MAAMDDIEQALRAAWDLLRPKLEQDPEKLRKRLARRQSKVIRQPPRAWCLAIKASDKRLDAPATPTPTSDQHQEIVLDSITLRKLCAPVAIEPPGEPL